jgi:hypothetical protein
LLVLAVALIVALVWASVRCARWNARSANARYLNAR